MTTTRQEWEYFIYGFDSLAVDLLADLRGLGEAGWELVGIHVVNQYNAKYIFKRPKQC